MSKKILLPLGILLVVLGILGVSSLFTVHQTQQAIVLQFGNPKRVITEPGLNFKLPFVQNVQYYEARILNLDPPVERVLLADQKPLNVDSYARYRITDPLKFFQTVRLETGLRSRLNTIINSNLREVLGDENLVTVLSDERADIMQSINERVNRQAARFGIDVVDVRIGRTDLPQETSQAVYDRMKSEREREAAENRAEGQEVAQRIRASADREATVIRAEAQREADILRGEGEAQRTRTLNEAFGRDVAFFEFYRHLQAYETLFEEEGQMMVLSTDSEFLEFLKRTKRTGEGAAQE